MNKAVIDTDAATGNDNGNRKNDRNPRSFPQMSDLNPYTLLSSERWIITINGHLLSLAPGKLSEMTVLLMALWHLRIVHLPNMWRGNNEDSHCVLDLCHFGPISPSLHSVQGEC